MTTFDNREKAAENKFIHDAELQFKINAKRNKLLATWAAEKMGMDAEVATSYAGALVQELATSKAATIVAKIHADFAQHGLNISVEDITEQLVELENTAKREITSK